MKKVIALFFLIISICVVIFLEQQEKYPSNYDYIKACYDIDLSRDSNSIENCILRNHHSMVCLLSKEATQKLLSAQIFGYSSWSKIGPNEFYGNKDVDADGFVDTSLFTIYRHYKGLDQRIIINKLSGKLMIIST